MQTPIKRFFEPQKQEEISVQKKKVKHLWEYLNEEESEEELILQEEEIIEEQEAEVYCLCRQPENPDRAMIECGECRDWFHFDCVGMTPEEEKEHLDPTNGDLQWYCPSCVKDMEEDEKEDANDTKAKFLDLDADEDIQSIGCKRKSTIQDLNTQDGGVIMLRKKKKKKVNNKNQATLLKYFG